jgi:hypothetical protein
LNREKGRIKGSNSTSVKYYLDNIGYKS